MQRTSKACWLPRLAAAALALLLAGCGSGGGPAVHVEAAAWRTEPGAGWEPPASAPEALREAGGWSQVTLPHVRPRSLAQGNASLEAPPDVAWYRLEIPPALAAAPQQELFFYLPRWQTIGNVAVYMDGQLLHRTRGSRVWNSFNRPFWVPLDAARPGSSVLLRVASQQGVGSAVTTAWMGAEGALQWRYRLRSFVQTDFVSQTSIAFLFIGLFSLAVWCVRRREPMYLLFFAWSVMHLLRSQHFVMGDHPPPLPDDWFGWITVNSLGWSMVAIYSFAFRVHRKRMPWVAVAIAALVLLCSLLTLPVPLLLPHLNAILPVVYITITALTAVIAASGLWASWSARSREGLVLFLWFSLNVPAGVHDLLMMGYRDMEGIYLAPYTAIGLFAIVMAIVWRRYVGAIAQVEQLNADLESRLAVREAQLTSSHEQLRALERQQTLAAERQRLMQDMHDGIGSSLISALRMVERGQASTADTALVLKDCIDDLKLAIDSLDTTDADLLALLAAVRFRLAPRLKAAGIALTWSVQDLPPLPWLDPQNALHVLRILQEVLTNILKHSGARSIDVATAHIGGELLVRIRDDGQAFVPAPVAARPGAGKGLSNVRSRCAALGARCDWAPWEGGGEFSLWLPVARGNNPASP